MTKYTTVFFDWGGVVADDPGDQFLGILLKRHGATGEQISEIFETYMYRFMRGDMNEQEFYEALRTQYGFTIDDSISNEFMEWSGLVANERILDLIEEVKAAGMKVALISNVIEPTYNSLERAGMYMHFDQLIASCKVGYAKPDKEIYSLALERLGATAERSIFIDDKQRNLDPADEMGFTTILAENSEQIIEDLRSLVA